VRLFLFKLDLQIIGNKIGSFFKLKKELCRLSQSVYMQINKCCMSNLIRYSKGDMVHSSSALFYCSSFQKEESLRLRQLNL